MEKYAPPFKIDNQMLSLVSDIMERVGKVGSFENPNRFPILRKENRARSIHASCAIEANSLSFNQVEDIINGVHVIGPSKDILEIKNAIAAYSELGAFDPFSIKDLKRIHGILGKGIVHGAGDYRLGSEGVVDADGSVVFIAPPADLVPLQISSLLKWCKEHFSDVHPLILSSVFHYEFVFVHPFTDGNGRMARLWQTAILGRWKPIFYYLPIENCIRNSQSEYYQAISDSHITGDSNPFILFMLRMIDEALIALMCETSNGDGGSIHLKKLLAAMPAGVFFSANEILTLLNLKSKETLRKHYLNPAIESKLVVLEFPEKPTSRNQRYKKV